MVLVCILLVLNYSRKCYRQRWEFGKVYMKKLQGRQVILICEGEAYHFTSDDDSTTVDVLRSAQEETDTRVVLYCLYAKEQGYKTVQVRTDSDFFFSLLHYIGRLEGMTVLFDTGSGSHRKLNNMTDIQKNIAQHFLPNMYSADATLRKRIGSSDKYPCNIGSSGECLGHRGRFIERA